MLPGGIVYFWNLVKQAPKVGLSFLGINMERPAQPRQGIKQSALSLRSQTFAPAPIAPPPLQCTHVCLCVCVALQWA